MSSKKSKNSLLSKKKRMTMNWRLGDIFDQDDTDEVEVTIEESLSERIPEQPVLSEQPVYVEKILQLQ